MGNGNIFFNPRSCFPLILDLPNLGKVVGRSLLLLRKRKNVFLFHKGSSAQSRYYKLP